MLSARFLLCQIHTLKIKSGEVGLAYIILLLLDYNFMARHSTKGL